MTNNKTAPITAIVTAYRRIEQTLFTLSKLANCQPAPTEILVHVDGNESVCAERIREQFPNVKCFISKENIGPGGGRNKLISAAHNQWIASFDDDSYPMDTDYFKRVQEVIQHCPDAAVIAAKVFLSGDPVEPVSRQGNWQADFTGCACIYRQHIFLETSGYVPLAIAYGMEEVDLAMRLCAQGERIFQAEDLRVFHDTSFDLHGHPSINAATIRNLALLTFLRYPLSCWWIGLIQVINRVIWLTLHNRCKGIARGIVDIPMTLYQHRQYREILTHEAVSAYLKLRQNPGGKVNY